MMTRYDDGSGRYTRSDAELDAVLEAAEEQLRAYVDTRLDLQGGLTAILGTHTDPDAETATEAVTGEHGEVGSICGLLLGVVGKLDPLPVGETTPSVFSLLAVRGYLTELHAGLSQRAMSRPEAARLLRLIEHNLDEAAALTGSAQARRKRARRRIEDLRRLVADIDHTVTDLHPRIMRLFDDADDTDDAAPKIPTPHGPA